MDKWLWSKPMGSHFGVGAPPILVLVHFSGDWGCPLGYGILTHGQTGPRRRRKTQQFANLRNWTPVVTANAPCCTCHGIDLSLPCPLSLPISRAVFEIFVLWFKKRTKSDRVFDIFVLWFKKRTKSDRVFDIFVLWFKKRTSSDR